MWARLAGSCTHIEVTAVASVGCVGVKPQDDPLSSLRATPGQNDVSRPPVRPTMPERTLHLLALASLVATAAWASWPRMMEPQPPVGHLDERAVPWPPPSSTPPRAAGRPDAGSPEPRLPLASPYVTGGSCLDGHLFGSVWVASDGCTHCWCGDTGVGDGNGRIFCTELDPSCEKKSDATAPKTRHEPSPAGVRPVDDGF